MSEGNFDSRFSITINKEPTNADAEFLWARLREHGLAKLEKEEYKERFTFHILVKEQDTIQAGMIGMVYYRGMHIQLLWVSESLRFLGIGSRLLQEAEKLAREANCTLIYLDTFSFQAPQFYPKHGFEKFGEIKDFPIGNTRYFFVKKLL